MSDSENKLNWCDKTTIRKHGEDLLRAMLKHDCLFVEVDGERIDADVDNTKLVEYGAAFILEINQRPYRLDEFKNSPSKGKLTGNHRK